MGGCWNNGKVKDQTGVEKESDWVKYSYIPLVLLE